MEYTKCRSTIVFTVHYLAFMDMKIHSSLTDIAEKIESWLKSMKMFLALGDNNCESVLIQFWNTGMDANLRYCHPSCSLLPPCRGRFDGKCKGRLGQRTTHGENQKPQLMCLTFNCFLLLLCSCLHGLASIPFIYHYQGSKKGVIYCKKPLFYCLDNGKKPLFYCLDNGK